jgi:hypothetical protein
LGGEIRDGKNLSPRKIAKTCVKIKLKQKRRVGTRGMAQKVKCLSSKPKTLNSNLSTAKNNKIK